MSPCVIRSIHQLQTANTVVDRTHIIATGSLAKLSSTATGVSQILPPSRDRYQTTHDALKEILRDFQATRTDIHPIKGQLNEQSEDLEQEMLLIDTRRGNLESALAPDWPATSSVLTYRADSSGRSSSSNTALDSSIQSKKRQGSLQADPSPQKAKSFMAVCDGPGAAEDAPVGMLRKKSG